MESEFPSGETGMHGGAGRVVPFLVVVGGCLLAGILLGILAGGKFTTPASPSPPPAVFVFLGYDNLKQPRSLEAVWVLQLDGRGRAAYLGISPATILPLENGQPVVLRDYLADPSGAPARLYKIPRIAQPSTTVAFDEQGLAAIINRSGGLALDGKTYRGQEVVTKLSALADPLDGLRLQARVAKALFTAAGPCLGEAALAGLSPDHLITNIPAEMLIAECVSRGPYRTADIKVQALEEVMRMILPDGKTGLVPTGG
jgi:hypothetical protein